MRSAAVYFVGGLLAGSAITAAVAAMSRRWTSDCEPDAEPTVGEDPDRREAWLQQLSVSFDLYREFLDWRHKIMARLVLVLGAALLATRWVVENRGTQQLAEYPLVRALPLALSAAFCVVAALLDAVHQSVLKVCYRTGTQAEQRLGISDGLFDGLRERFTAPHPLRPGLNYRFILGVGYLVLAALLAFAAASMWNLDFET